MPLQGINFKSSVNLFFRSARFLFGADAPMRVLLSSRLCNAFFTAAVDVSATFDLANVDTSSNVGDASADDDASGDHDGRIDGARKIGTVLDDNTGVVAVNGRPVVVWGGSEGSGIGVVDGSKKLLSISGGELEISWDSVERVVGHSSSGTT